MGQLQRELLSTRDRGEDRERKTELALENLEALITHAGEESARQLRTQAEENAANIDKVRQVVTMPTP